MTMTIELKQREFPASVVRSCCSVIYGKAISNDAWGNWRTWANVPHRSRLMTFEQFTFLAAVAQIRAEDENRYRELSRDEVCTLASSSDFQAGIVKAIEFLDASGKVVGRDAPIALSNRGASVGLSDLYRRIPGFCVHKVYDVRWLEIMAC
ncbi:hypothetical protein IFO70_10215 [Phormidium tenue FACHB-886]|nr:hypothetical protein [Phormidium tenue FACHB-886]